MCVLCLGKPYSICTTICVTCIYCALQEKIRQRIHFHGTDRESLMTFIDKSMLLKKHGGELEITEGSIGMDLWRLFCLFDPLFVGNG